MSRASRRPRSTRPLAALAATLASVVIGVLVAPAAAAGPIGYDQPAFRAAGAAAAGQTLTLSPSGPCRPGHGGYGRAYLFAPLDRSYTSSAIASAPITVDRRTNSWAPVRITVPGNASPGTYRLGVSCGGYPGTGVETSYRGVVLKVTGNCNNPFFVGLRGSGEPATAAQNGLGTLVDYVYRQTRSRSGTAMDVIPQSEQYDRYDAVEVGDKNYFNSVGTGKSLALEQVRSRIRACEDRTRIVMAGYSQGAHAVHDTLAALSSSERGKVVGVVVFGSPVHTPFVNGDAGPGRGIGFLGPRRALGDGLPSRMRDYCNLGDAVCDGAGVVSVGLLAFRDCDRSGPACPHVHYIATHADQAAEYLAGRLAGHT